MIILNGAHCSLIVYSPVKLHVGLFSGLGIGDEKVWQTAGVVVGDQHAGALKPLGLMHQHVATRVVCVVCDDDACKNDDIRMLET